MKCLTFDVGGTFIKYAIIEDGTISDKHRIPTPVVPMVHRVDMDEETNDLYKLKAAEYCQIIKSVYEQYREQVDGIAMSVPGVLDAFTGYLYTGGALNYFYEVNFAQMISQLCDNKPVTIENDAKAAAKAELCDGALVGTCNSAVIIFGTAVGGCTIVDGNILRGMHSYAGEYSQICTTNKGQNGVEFWGSSGSVHRMYEEYAERADVPAKSIDGEDLFRRANEGDELAIECIRNYCRNICYPICNIQAVIDPEIIAIGGGVSAQKLFFDILNQEMDKVFLEYCDGFPKPNLVLCKYRDSANLIGAYYHFCELMQTRENNRCETRYSDYELS